MIRMTNHRVARRSLAAALCLTVLLDVPAVAHAAEPLEPTAERVVGAIEPITFQLPEPTGRKNLGTTEVDPDRSVFAQRTYLAAFFDQTLRNRPRSLLRTESPRFPEVRFAR